jgi:hypothetical protein
MMLYNVSKLQVSAMQNRGDMVQVPLGHQFWWNLTIYVMFHRPERVSGTRGGTPADLDQRSSPAAAAWTVSTMAR